jgi:thiamine-phosphate pyrophosphorylase
MSRSSLGFSLYLITDRAGSRLPLAEAVNQALDAGLEAVQLREKDLGVREMLELANTMRAATRKRGARLLVNDRADVAMAVGADGVQRTGESLPVAALRRAVGERLLIGASVHSLAEATDAAAAGADFLVFGPVYDTPSKRPYGPPQGLQALARVAGAVDRPVLAVGGITPARIAEVLRAGASGVAVISAILAADRPADATRAFLGALGHA